MSDNKITGPVIGIDLGTTYSAVCHYANSSTTVIANDQGNRTTPSIVAFTPTERLVGESAKNQAASNPANTVYEIKRLMGRTWDDKKVQEAIKKFPFEIVNQNNKPCVKVMFMGEEKIFTPEEISAMILGDLKKTAETFLGQPVTYAVVTVPAYFTEQAKQATKDAATIAGLTVLRLLTEPTAASIAYGIDKDTSTEKTICVCDAGGGTYDISVLSICDGVFEVKAVGGDAFLGGADIDNVLVEYTKGEFKKNTGVDISSNPKAIRRLRTACEHAKRILSTSSMTDIEIDSLAEGNDFKMKLSRAKFESLTNDLINKHVELIGPVLEDAKVKKDQIDNVVMVGGTTRIPKLKDMIETFFNGKKLSTDVNPDEAVAIGAAIQAAVLAGSKDAKIGELLVLDVTPLSIGIETAGGVMTKIIEKNSTIPCNKNRSFSTYEDNQSAVDINIFQGERPLVSYCNKLGTFRVSNITPAPRGTPQIVVEMAIDADGILEVTAKEEKSGSTGNIKITNDTNRLSKEDVDKMAAEAEKYKEEDDKIRASRESMNALDGFLHGASNSVDEMQKKYPQVSVDELLTKLKEGRTWLYDHPSESAETYSNKMKELREFFDKTFNQSNDANNSDKETKDADDVDINVTSNDTDVKVEDIKVEDVKVEDADAEAKDGDKNTN